MAQKAETLAGRMYLASTHPSIAAEFISCNDDKCLENTNICTKHSVDNLTHGSHRKVTWLCPAGHTYVAQVRSRTDKSKPTNCAICSGASVPFSLGGNIIETHPLIAKYAVSCAEENCNDCYLESFTAGSNHKWSWICESGHITIGSISHRTRTSQSWNCDECKHDKLRDSDIAIEFISCLCPTCQESLTPSHSIENLSIGSGKTCLWQCLTCHDQWEARIADRLHKEHPTGCPSCVTPGTSYREQSIFTLLADILTLPYAGNIKVEGWDYPVDFVHHDSKTVIQYDSYYYHKDRTAADKRCNKILKQAGWNVLRIREAGLPSLRNPEVKVTSRESAELVCEKILKHLHSKNQLTLTNK